MAANEFTSDLISDSPTANVPELATYLAHETGCDAGTAERVAWNVIKHYVLRVSLPDCSLRLAVEARQHHARENFEALSAHAVREIQAAVRRRRAKPARQRVQ